MSGFMFDFSSPSSTDGTETNPLVNDVPVGEECTFNFYGSNTVMTMGTNTIQAARLVELEKMKQNKHSKKSSHDDDDDAELVEDSNEKGCVFLETVLSPFNSYCSKESKPTTGQTVSIFHRQAPRIDVLELVTAKTNEEKCGGSKGSLDACQATDVVEKGRRDIVQGAYYGGLKVWSCAPDVAEVIVFGHPAPPLSSSCSSSSSDEDTAKNRQNDEKGNFSANLFDYFGTEVASQSRLLPRHEAFVVAELGCGQSLPTLGLLQRLFKRLSPGEISANDAAILNTKFLLFLHDYNKEVISEVSVPNVSTSLDDLTKISQDDKEKVERDENARGVPRFSADQLTFGLGFGDWSSVAPCSFAHEALNPNGFVDMIIAADVTFDMEATEKFLLTAARVLRPPSAKLLSAPSQSDQSKESNQGGFAIVGTKDYYFGTNGGLVEMKEVIKKYRLPLELVELGKRGVGSMVRVLVTLRRI